MFTKQLIFIFKGLMAIGLYTISLNIVHFEIDLKLFFFFFIDKLTLSFFLHLSYKVTN